MKPTAYDSITFASLNVAAGIPLTPSGPSRQPIVLHRANTSPLYAGIAQDAALLTISFEPLPGVANMQTTLMALLGSLEPDNEKKRPLTILCTDGTIVDRDMAVVDFRWGQPNELLVDFVADDPVWWAESDTTGAVSTDNALIDVNPSCLMAGRYIERHAGLVVGRRGLPRERRIAEPCLDRTGIHIGTRCGLPEHDVSGLRAR
jgi:hypothetical protein